jgi:hypothetical protein
MWMSLAHVKTHIMCKGNNLNALKNNYCTKFPCHIDLQFKSIAWKNIYINILNRIGINA